MPDILKCHNGQDCPQARDCYRWTSEPAPFHQAYGSLYKPEDNGDCPFFMGVRDADV